MRAHPRSRGENGRLDQVDQPRRGSSPLTRGKLPVPPGPVPDRRLIPAHAGKTRLDAGLASSSWAHPRSRGENYATRRDLRRPSGSSPLTRGKRTLCQEMGQCPRLIPAHAGKTRLMSAGMIQARAHPRSRGENGFHDRGRGHGDGSSPLTRGKLRTLRGELSLRRLIPAHAGKTLCLHCVHHGVPAHPRSRGENAVGPTGTIVDEGSSPLTRGKHEGVHLVAAPGRLIPAHAGKT